MKKQVSLKKALQAQSGFVRPAKPAHAILNHKGERIPVSGRTIKTLDSMKCLFWNRRRKLHQIKREMVGILTEMMREPFFTPRGATAVDPGWVNARPKDGAPPNPLLLELGPDLSGCVAVDCSCSECMRKLEDMDKTRLPWGVYNRIHTQEAH